jgi:hypothetical protein
MVSVFNGMWQALQTLGVVAEPSTCRGENPAGTAAATAQPATVAGHAAAEQMEQTRSYCSGSASSCCCSSSSSQPVRWQYLLRLHESRKLAAAAAAVSARWSQDEVQAVLQRYKEQRVAEATAFRAATIEELQALEDRGEYEIPTDVVISNGELLQRQQLYQDVLVFCRTLVAVAPLPVVCNNPGCIQLGGVSEALAARYVCAGCGCRYCSAACQAAGWRSHKKGCRRMAACGMKVDGKL